MIDIGLFEYKDKLYYRLNSQRVKQCSFVSPAIEAYRPIAITTGLLVILEDGQVLELKGAESSLPKVKTAYEDSDNDQVRYHIKADKKGLDIFLKQNDGSYKIIVQFSDHREQDCGLFFGDMKKFVSNSTNELINSSI